MNDIIFGIGSNLNPKFCSIKKALDRLSEFVNISAVSSAYKSRSILMDGQPDYINIVVCGKTHIIAEDVLLRVKKIEESIGRVYSGRWRERLIDIDIIDYNRNVYSSEELNIPHSEMHKRVFVLKPLAEINSSYYHPILRLTVLDILVEIENEYDIVNIGRIAWQL